MALLSVRGGACAPAMAGNNATRTVARNTVFLITPPDFGLWTLDSGLWTYLLTARRTPNPTNSAPVARFNHSPDALRVRRRRLMADADQTSRRHHHVPVKMKTAPRNSSAMTRDEHLHSSIAEVGSAGHLYRDERMRRRGQDRRQPERCGYRMNCAAGHDAEHRQKSRTPPLRHAATDDVQRILPWRDGEEQTADDE